MRYLLIDNSNTRTKFRLASPTGLAEERPWLATAELTVENIQNLTKNWEFDAIMMCSVVPEKAAVIREALAIRAPFEQLTAQSNLGIKIDYPNPHQIGADRLANALGVVAHYRFPAIVIDFGTAVTFDVISPTGAYCGGVIAPGLGAMNEYLHRKTALLPLIELAEPESAIGKSTVEAMRAGAVYGYRGLVKEIISQIKKEMQVEPTIIATGGDAALIAKGVPEIHSVDSLITIKGLHHAARVAFEQ